MPTANEIRQQFIDFFCAKHGHTFVPSSPVVPFDDPTLLFTNAGMNQFKDVFLGTGTRPYKRAANTQKCIRAGGKHNDLDDVGKDTYHHTFFEMLGNWSFGDYFKREAIRWAWELLTDVWKIDKSRLHVTVFEGDPANGVPRDDEAAGFWRSETDIDPNHIHFFGKKDNFWEMGETGPCGPCTEIHYDRTADMSGAQFVNKGSPDVIEIWNLVFIQYNRNADQSLTPLPAKHVDTGMGFERITAVLQGKSSNYDTDVFTPIFAAIQKETNAPHYTGKLDDLKDTAYRVIADHIRTLTFAITDGAVPSNEKRGYVLRSVLRRAVRYGWQQFGVKTSFLHKLVPIVVSYFGQSFPELSREPNRVQGIVEQEEVGFRRTLMMGLSNFSDAAVQAIARSYAKKHGLDSSETCWKADHYDLPNHAFRLRDSQWTKLPDSYEGIRAFVNNQCAYTPCIDAKTAFDLHTEQGFFIDIAQQMAAEAGLAVDREGYDRLFEAFKEISAQGRKKLVVSAVKGELPKTSDDAKYTVTREPPGLSRRSGEPSEPPGQVRRLAVRVLGWVKDNAVISAGSIGSGESIALLLDRTNFYGEQGGQVGDTGVIRSESGADFEVEDTQRLGDAVLHIGTLQQGRLNVGDAVELVLKTERRLDIQRHHTATHLLNLALKQSLGAHIEQKGSLVDDSKTRFDFSHDKPLSADHLRQIEEKVNNQVLADLGVTAIVMPLAEAKKIVGVRAVFGEKYPDPVRVVMIGPDKPELVTPEFSAEFCGGTHVERTGSIGPFKIISQESVAKGVRRVTAVAGRTALAELQSRSATLDALAAKLQCQAAELPSRLEALQDELKKLQSAAKKGAAADLAGIVDRLVGEAATVADAKLVVGTVPAAGSDAIRAQVDRIRSKVGRSIVIFGWDDKGNAGLLVGVTDDLAKTGLHAGKLVGEAAKIVEGKGGGNPTLAQAGGKNVAKLGDALAHVASLVTQTLTKA
jgi:alanyl-tRNA synthetase